MADNKNKVAISQLVASQQDEITALLEGTAAKAVEGTAPAEAPAPAEVAAPSVSGAVAEVEPVVPPAEGEALVAEGTPAPTEYFGVDLSDIPEEARQPFIDELRERDTLINRLLRERAAGEVPAAPAAPVAEEPLTDEAILLALGQDPEMLDESAAKALVLLGRQLVETQTQVAQMAERTAIAETQNYWDSNLAALEKEFGDLPVTRQRFFEYAIEHNIGDPALAYWAVVGPTRAEVTTEVKKRKEATAEAKRAAATLRPSAATDLVAAALQSKDTKSATKEAALQVLQKLGLA